MDAHEKLIVTSLSKHATEAPSDEDLLAAVHYRLERRRTGRAIGAAVLACAVVATAITATHSISTELRTDPEVARPGTPDAGWRWESYKTVQVQVPANWSQYISGSAPCTFSTSWTPVIGRFNGWFNGRRIPCVAAVLPVAERREYLWFDDVQDPGITTYDGGWTEETRVVGGVKLSVLTTDDALRKRVLDSARPIIGTDDHGCTPAEPRSARPNSPAGGLAPNEKIESAGICEYWRGLLVAGSQLPTGPATELARRLANSPTGEARWPEGCEDQAPRNFVITLHGRSTSWSVRVSYSTCYSGTSFPADDGTTRRLADVPTLDLIRQGVHNPSQPSDLIDPPATATPSRR